MANNLAAKGVFVVGGKMLPLQGKRLKSFLEGAVAQAVRLRGQSVSPGAADFQSDGNCTPRNKYTPLPNRSVTFSSKRCYSLLGLLLFGGNL
jgi:hypothetical protein